MDVAGGGAASGSGSGMVSWAVSARCSDPAVVAGQ